MEPKPFTVVKVLGSKPVELSHGSFTQHDLMLEGVGKCQWLSKQAEPPREGEQLIGVTEDTNYGKRFKKQAQQSFNGGGGKDPATQRSIVRQHSQEMALRYAEIQGLRNKLPDDFKLEHLTPIVEWFVKDAES